MDVQEKLEGVGREEEMRDNERQGSRRWKRRMNARGQG